MKRALPKRKLVTHRDIANTRVRAKMLIKYIHKSGTTIDTFNYEHSMVNGLTKSMDNITDDIIDDAIVCAKEVLHDYMADDSQRIKIIAMLERLGEIDPGFTYNLCMNKDNELTGFVWMTSVMRSNFQRFGNFLCLDAMKKKLMYIYGRILAQLS